MAEKGEGGLPLYQRFWPNQDPKRAALRFFRGSICCTEKLGAFFFCLHGANDETAFDKRIDKGLLSQRLFDSLT
jgi:hypothetical protein